jgi:hypothetical protein
MNVSHVHCHTADLPEAVRCFAERCGVRPTFSDDLYDRTSDAIAVDKMDRSWLNRGSTHPYNVVSHGDLRKASRLVVLLPIEVVKTAACCDAANENAREPLYSRHTRSRALAVR